MRSSYSDIFHLLFVFGGIDSGKPEITKFDVQILINEQIGTL